MEIKEVSIVEINKMNKQLKTPELMHFLKIFSICDETGGRKSAAKKHRRGQNKRGTVISRHHPLVNFGQTVEIVDFDKNNMNFIIKPDGQNNFVDILYHSLWVHKNNEDLAKIRNKLNKLGN